METWTGKLKDMVAVSEEVWKVWTARAPGTGLPFCCRARLMVRGKVTPAAGPTFPWNAAEYRPGLEIVKSLLPAVWEMSVPDTVEFWSNSRAVLLLPGAEGVE